MGFGGRNQLTGQGHHHRDGRCGCMHMSEKHTKHRSGRLPFSNDHSSVAGSIFSPRSSASCVCLGSSSKTPRACLSSFHAASLPMCQALDLTDSVHSVPSSPVSLPRSLFPLDVTFPACLSPSDAIPAVQEPSASGELCPFSHAVAGMIKPALEAHLLCGLWTDIPEGGAVSRACQPEDCGYMPMPVRWGAGFYQYVSPHTLPLTRPHPSLGLVLNHPLL